jgi:hypothetical protein
MPPTDLTPKWKRWIKPGRLIPSLTILGAGSVGVLSYLGIVVLSIPESIIIALLGLLAVDAFVERIDILERIENKLSRARVGEPLKRRVDLLPIREEATNASEICIIAVAATTLITYHHNFFESLIRNGCKIRIILLNPDGVSLQTWNLQSKIPRSQEYIRTSLESLKKLVQLSKVKGKCEVMY